MAQNVDSTSDERTANNAVRHQYRVLSDAEKAQMAKIKDMGAAFVAELMKMEGLKDDEVLVNGARLFNRDLELARQHMEDAVMRAVRHITA